MKKCMFILMILFTAVSVAQADLIAHYTMEEASGAITDQVGGETAEPVDTGHAYGAASYPGFGSATGLTDNGSWQLDATESAELQALTNNFTVASWVYIDSELRAAKTGTNANNDRVIGDDVAWDGDAWSFGIRDGNLLFTKNGVVDVFSTVTVPTDQWVHIAVAVSSTTGVEYYLNGTLAQTVGNTAGCNAGDDVFGVGRSYGNGEAQWFAGSLDDVRVYNNVLTEAEVAALMDSGNTAVLIAPADGATTQPIDVDLQWSAPSVLAPSGYTLNIRADDPNWLDTANNAVINGATSPYTTALQRDTTYYWRVDAIDPNDGGNPIVVEGFTWSFTTVLSIPEFSAGLPADALADAGSDVVFEVSAVNPFTLDSTGMTYQWYKDANSISDGTEYLGTTSDTLTVTSVNAADEGDYHCQVIITSNGGQADSPTARLDVKRVIGYWPFDADFTDMVGTNDGVPTAASARAFTPVIGVGEPNAIIGGGAAKFSSTYVGADNDPAGGAVVIPTPERLLGDNSFSISFWEKSNSAESSRYHVASGTDDSGIGNFFMWRYVDPYPNAYAINLGPWAGAYPLFTDNLYPEDQWHFMAITYDADTGQATVYVDGVTADSATVTTYTGFASEIYVGNRKNMARPFSGNIDELKIYNYAVTPTQVAVEYTDTIDAVVCTESIVGDLDGDCQVDTDDLALMALSWLDCNWIPSCL